jgi:hypothetical protein
MVSLIDFILMYSQLPEIPATGINPTIVQRYRPKNGQFNSTSHSVHPFVASTSNSSKGSALCAMLTASSSLPCIGMGRFKQVM